MDQNSHSTDNSADFESRISIDTLTLTEKMPTEERPLLDSAEEKAIQTPPRFAPKYEKAFVEFSREFQRRYPSEQMFDGPAATDPFVTNPVEPDSDEERGRRFTKYMILNSILYGVCLYMAIMFWIFGITQYDRYLGAWMLHCFWGCFIGVASWGAFRDERDDATEDKPIKKFHNGLRVYVSLCFVELMFVPLLWAPWEKLNEEN